MAIELKLKIGSVVSLCEKQCYGLVNKTSWKQSVYVTIRDRNGGLEEDDWNCNMDVLDSIFANQYLVVKGFHDLTYNVPVNSLRIDI